MTYSNHIMHGDATRMLATLPDGCADLIITDPPYLVGYRDRQGRTIANDDNPQAVLSAFPEMARVLKNDSYCILFCGWSAIAQFSEAWEQAGLRAVGQIVWRKSYTSHTWHTECRHESAFLLAKGRPPKPLAPVSDVQEWEYSGNRFHPTEKGEGGGMRTAAESIKRRHSIRHHRQPGGESDRMAGRGSRQTPMARPPRSQQAVTALLRMKGVRWNSVRVLGSSANFSTQNLHRQKSAIFIVIFQDFRGNGNHKEA